MLRELLAKEQSEKNTNQENESPPVSTRQPEISSIEQRDDEDFVPVSHHDIDEDEGMEDVDSDQYHEAEELTSSLPTRGLQRIPGSILDLDDESEHSFLSPLIGHLAGRLNRPRSIPNKFAPLHPYTSILSLSDVDECVRVESEAFPEHERCSREKVIILLLLQQPGGHVFYLSKGTKTWRAFKPTSSNLTAVISR